MDGGGRISGDRIAVLAAVLVAYVVGLATWHPGWTVGAAVAAWLLARATVRHLSISGAPSAALTGAFERESDRYAPPPDALRPLLAGLSVSRRPKASPWVIALGCALLFVPYGVLALLVLVPVGYVVSMARGAGTLAQLTGHEIELRGERLVQVSPEGEALAAIDLRRPFTYEYVTKDDCEAVYRLRQSGVRVEFPSSSRNAPWVARDVLGVEWPPANLAMRDFT